MLGPPILAPRLAPLTDIQDVDSIWLLMALLSCAVWSRRNARWTSVVLGGTLEGGELDEADNDELDALQVVEQQFLRYAGVRDRSPFTFLLTADGDDAGEAS